MTRFSPLDTDPNEPLRFSEHTPLHWAVSGHTIALSSLLAHPKIDPNKRDRIGNTPLHLSALTGQTEATLQLIQHRLTNLNAKNKLGWTPLHQATTSCQASVVELLLKHSVDPTQVNKEGNTPLDLAHNHTFHQITKLLQPK